MRIFLASLNQRIELIRVIRKVVRLQDHQFAAPDDDRGFAVEGCVGKFPELALGFTDRAGFLISP